MSVEKLFLVIVQKNSKITPTNEDAEVLVISLQLTRFYQRYSSLPTPRHVVRIP